MRLLFLDVCLCADCSNFMSFLAQPVMASLSESFCWYHIDIPGQVSPAARPGPC